MASWDNGVAVPGGASYMAPLLSFSGLGEIGDAYNKGNLSRQEQDLNKQRLAQGQTQLDIASTFKNGLPTDPATGQIDYKKAVAMLAQKGDINSLWNGADAMLSQSATNQSPMLTGGVQPPQGAQSPQGAPASVPARPLPPPAANSPQGDSGSGTVAALVTDRLPNQDATTGKVIGEIAQKLGIDPNAPMTPGQMRRAQGLLQRYTPAVASADGATPSFNSRFAGDSGGGSLPPSANAVAPAPKASADGGRLPVSQPQPQGPGAAPGGAPQRAPIGARGPGGPAQPMPQPQQPPQATPMPQPQPQPQQPQPAPAQPQGGPITPQVPLPKGFNDPQQAILALHNEAARLSSNPRAKGQVDALNDWATRIESSIAPLSVQPNATIVDPRTGKTLYQGPGAAAMAGAGGRSETVESDAEIYRQTGKMPAGIARTPQGQAEAHAIRQLARQKEIEEGGNPDDWASRWQNFTTQATGKRVLEQRAAGLSLAENEASSLIPRVRDISAKVSRTNYPTLNSLILASQKGSGGTDVIKLGIAIESLVPVYARVLKPVGQVGQGDMSRAHDILDKAWSDGQIGAALDQMQVELKSARTALDKTMTESENRGRTKKDAEPGGQAAPAAADGAGKGSAAKVSPGGVGWSIVN